MREKQIKHHLDGLAALLLFGVFAVCVLIVLLSGADAYRGLTERDRAAYTRRTCAQYVATRVRQSDSAWNIAVTDFGDGKALVLDANWDYVTYIYCHDGWLMELYCLAEETMEPEDGEKILAAQAMDFTLEDGLLAITARDSAGGETSLLLSLRSGEGGAP